MIPTIPLFYSSEFPFPYTHFPTDPIIAVFRLLDHSIFRLILYFVTIGHRFLIFCHLILKLICQEIILGCSIYCFIIHCIFYYKSILGWLFYFVCFGFFIIFLTIFIRNFLTLLSLIILINHINFLNLFFLPLKYRLIYFNLR